MAAGEIVDELNDIPVGLHGEHGQTKTGDPSFGFVVQRLDMSSGQSPEFRIPKEVFGFIMPESEIGLTNLRQGTVDPPSTQSQGRVPAGGHHDVEKIRSIIDESVHGLVYEGFGDEMIVVEDQDERFGSTLQIVDQRGEKSADVALPCFSDEGVVSGDEFLVGPRQGPYDDTPESRKIVVPFVEGHPGGGQLSPVDPRRDQSCLSETCRRGDQGEAAGHRSIQGIK